jgi:predicted nucleic acid-binding protein
MTSAADSLFVDTNVLVYASWAIAPLHTHARSILATHSSAGASLAISRQVIREWLATLNRPRTGLALAELIAEAQTFLDCSHRPVACASTMSTLSQRCRPAASSGC